MVNRFIVTSVLVACAMACAAGEIGPRDTDLRPEDTALDGALAIAAHAPLRGSGVADPNLMLASLYARHGAVCLWSGRDGVSTQARQLIETLQSADTFGLNPADYAASELVQDADRLSTDASAAERARFDIAVSLAVIRFVSNLHYGRVDPRAAGFELKEPRADLDVPATVASLASARDVGDAIRAVEPHFYHYTLLKLALAKYRALEAAPLLTVLPKLGNRTLHVGDDYIGAPALRNLLTALGDLPTTSDPVSIDESLDADSIDALKRFQYRHGLAADGILDNQVFAALTTPIATRVQQIQLTLERWRWLPAFETPPIIVNIPQFRLFAFRNVEDRAASILQMNVIVGETYPRTQTPVFIGDMKYVVFRPYWDVPRSITMREMLPKIHRQPTYLQRNALQIVRGQSDAATVLEPDPAAIDALAAGRARLRQLPGAANALGLIKFIFPNVHNVYLHSTPENQLFSRSRRAFSHGCIRVSDPAALAAFVLQNADGMWGAERIAAAMQGADSTRVELRTPIHVMILYATVQATEAGPIQFFDDIYGHDRKLADLLANH